MAYLSSLGKNLNCAINVYGVLMSFVLNKHITIFTDNDMYHANVATLGNRSPILNEHIDYVLYFYLFYLKSHLCIFPSLISGKL